TQFNQLWEIDASPSDVLCTDGRYSIYVLVDIYSRWPKIRVTKTPRMAAALLLVRDCILDFGMPRELSTDNGSDFIGDQFRTTIRHLGIHQHVCDPFSPEQKACVERTIGTIQHSFMELQPGYIGHSVAERKRIEERKAFANRLGAEDDKVFQVELTGEDLQQRLNNWVDNVYVHRPHDGLDGRTPFEMRSGYRGTISRLPEDAEGLLEHMLMAPADGKTRIVSKKGVRVDTIEYLFTDAVLMPGEEVHVRLDPDDLGRVYLYQDDPWRFVSVAINPERTGVSRAEAAVKLKRSQAEVIAEGKKKIRADMRGINLATVTERMAQRGQEETASLLAFPTKSETHVTPEIEAAAKAKRAGKAPVTPIRTEADKKAAEALVAELKAKPVDERAVKRARVERALAIEATLAAGEPAHEEDIRWFETYRTLPEFKTAKVMLEDFGRLVV
ncbi:MAG: transposase family protein, partial [Rhodospirillum sp.]|nr:transposase family protein [Rhodospirillum sp.]